MSGWDSIFSFGVDVIDNGLDASQGDIATVASQASGMVDTAGQPVVQGTNGDSWWVAPIKQALPQIMQMTGKRARSPGSTATASAKPVSGSAGSAMEVPKMIGKAASQNPLEGIQQWGNLF